MYTSTWGKGITAKASDLRLTRGKLVRQHVVSGLSKPVVVSHDKFGGPVTIAVAGQITMTTRSMREAITWCLDNLSTQPATV